MKQREPRFRVMLPASMRWAGDWHGASIRNVSNHGVLLCAAQVPPVGSYVEVRVGAETITARTVWSEEQACGLRARSRVDFDRLHNPASRVARSASVSEFGANVASQRGDTDYGRVAACNRARSYALQYLTALVVALLVAGSVGWEVYCTLSAPLSAASAAMGETR